MNLPLPELIPQITSLPITLPREGAIGLELEQGFIVLRVADSVQQRIEELLEKQLNETLSTAEAEELQQYEEMDDYLSFLNRLSRNLVIAQSEDNPRAA